MINATKQTYQLLTRIHMFAPHFKIRNSCNKSIKQADNLDQIWSLCRHFVALAQDKKAGNDYDSRKQEITFIFNENDVTNIDSLHLYDITSHESFS